MSRILILSTFILFALSCKNEKVEQVNDFQTQVKEKLNLDVDKLTEKIKVFYVQKYITQGVEYHVKKIDILQIQPVSGYYVDSLKSELYQSGLKRISDNLEVRNKMIENMMSKARLYEKDGKNDKAEAIKQNVESYQKRNALQEDEFAMFKKRDSLVQIRMTDQNSGDLKYFQVDFLIKDQLEHLLRSDTSSLIFNKNHQIEDLLNDKVWDGSF